jgi:hypothetical protein
LLISAHNYNYKNFWSGEWLSFWQLKKSSDAFEIIGDIKISTYYYEEGNVQFKLSNSFMGKTTTNKHDNESADQVINFIMKSENKIQEDLEKVYDDLSENYLKPLRRRIPFTGQRMNWNLNQIAFTSGK